MKRHLTISANQIIFSSVDTFNIYILPIKPRLNIIINPVLVVRIVQDSKVRSPANFRVLPLKETSRGVTFDAGSAADLTSNLDLSRVLTSVGATSGKERTTSNKLLLVPPPDSLLLKSVIFLKGGGFSCCLVAIIV
jgi:hypothetical protein